MLWYSCSANPFWWWMDGNPFWSASRRDENIAKTPSCKYSIIMKSTPIKKYTNIKIKFDDYFAYPGPILCWKGTITLSTCQFFKQYFWIQNDIGLLIVVIEELVNAWNAVQQSNCVHCCAKSTLQSDFVFLHFCIFYLLVHILYIVFVIVLPTPRITLFVCWLVRWSHFLPQAHTRIQCMSLHVRCSLLTHLVKWMGAVGHRAFKCRRHKGWSKEALMASS